MGDQPAKWVCSHCGYSSSGKFVGDICPICDLTYWKCAEYGFLITAEKATGCVPGMRREMWI
jgi:hypothetical protein